MKITLTNQEFQDLIDGYVETGKDVLKRSGFLPDFELMPKLDKDIEEAFSSFAQESFAKLIERQKKIGTGILSILEITDPNAAIAGGAVFGLKLNALILPDNKIVSMQSDMPNTDRANMPKYLVQDDVYVFS